GAQLGIWQISADRAGFWIRDYFYWPGAVLSTGSALVVGALAARAAARSADHRVGAAASGAAGPLLVAVAYLLAVPRLAGIAPEQLSAHLIAPYAVIAGVAGSVLVAALAPRRAPRATARAAAEAGRNRPAQPPRSPPATRHRLRRSSRPPARRTDRFAAIADAPACGTSWSAGAGARTAGRHVGVTTEATAAPASRRSAQPRHIADVAEAPPGRRRGAFRWGFEAAPRTGRPVGRGQLAVVSRPARCARVRCRA